MCFFVSDGSKPNVPMTTFKTQAPRGLKRLRIQEFETAAELAGPDDSNFRAADPRMPPCA
jgi:hypothetical protein